MDIEQIIEAAKGGDADGVKRLLSEHVQGAVEEHTSGLTRKRDELLSEVKGLKGYKELGDLETLQERLGRLSELEKAAEASSHDVSEEKVRELAEKWAKEQISSVTGEWEQRHKTEREAREAAEAEVTQLRDARDQSDIRREILDAAGSDVVEGLEDDLVHRLRAIFTFENDENGNRALIARDPETGVRILGADGQVIKPSDAIEALKKSEGNKPWNSRGRGFFKSTATGTGTVPGGGPGGRNVDLGKLDMDAYIAARAQSGRGVPTSLT